MTITETTTLTPGTWVIGRLVDVAEAPEVARGLRWIPGASESTPEHRYGSEQVTSSMFSRREEPTDTK
jgi:hypothetical protein